MEDTETDTMQPAMEVSVSAAPTSFDPRTQRLLDYLSAKSERLCDMLKGAWTGLGQSEDNPDLHAQIAHSVRELMEKAPRDLATIPMQLNSGELVGQVRILSAKWKAAAIPLADTEWNGIINITQKQLLTGVGALFEDFDSKYPPNNQRRSALIQALDGSTIQIPEQIMAQRIEAWKQHSEYFIAVAHHNKTTTLEELRNNLMNVEQLLVDILAPEVIPVLDELDELIESTEAAS